VNSHAGGAGSITDTLIDSNFSVAFSPDGRILATGILDVRVEGNVILWTVVDRAHPRRLATLGGIRLQTMTFSPDGGPWPLAASTTPWSCGMSPTPNHPGPLATLTLSGESETHTLKQQAVAFSPDGHTLAAASTQVPQLVGT
jgi:WD40 repeat protein